MIEPEDKSEPGRDVIGVLGGTFDPIHLGHLHVAECVHRALPVSRLIVVPCNAPPHKTRRDLSPSADRLAMLRLAVEHLDWLAISTLELERGGYSYTIDTLRELSVGPPPVAPIFVMGTDALFEIHTWKSYRDLIREFDLVCVDRPGTSIAVVAARLEADISRRIVHVSPGENTWNRSGEPPFGRGGRIYHLPIQEVPISSSEIREAAAAGASLHGLVPPPVARYIDREGLYGRRKEERS
jgi:nicotinate-nucleotide adenylyltransferase